MNPKKNVTTTRGPWGYGSTSGHGINGHKINPHRFFHDANGNYVKGSDGKPVGYLRGTLAGVTVATREEVEKLGLLYGYTNYYGRNSCGFVMSRAARKRGYTTTDGMYNRAVKRGGK